MSSPCSGSCSRVLPRRIVLGRSPLLFELAGLPCAPSRSPFPWMNALPNSLRVAACLSARPCLVFSPAWCPSRARAEPPASAPARPCSLAGARLRAPVFLRAVVPLAARGGGPRQRPQRRRAPKHIPLCSVMATALSSLCVLSPQLDLPRPWAPTLSSSLLCCWLPLRLLPALRPSAQCPTIVVTGSAPPQHSCSSTPARRLVFG